MEKFLGSVQLDHRGMSIEGMVSERTRNRSDEFGEPSVVPRVGNKYQAQIPPMIPQSERLQLFNVWPSLLMGLPIPVMWINDNLNNHKNGERLNNSENSQLNSNKKTVQVRVQSSDVGLQNEELLSPSVEAEKANWDRVYRSKKGSFVPGSLGGFWSEVNQDTFILGLYIFGKKFLLLKKFMETIEMGEILSFYYEKFYGSDRHRKWSNCRKMKSNGIMGKRLFEGWRQHELLSRLLPHVSEEAHALLVEVSEKFSEGVISLEYYVSTLKATAGISMLIKAVGIGKGEEDLTSLACPSHTPDVIKEFLTGGLRLSKAKSNHIFWEAVWPRLVAKGWYSEKNKKKDHLFLMPGVGKISRTKRVKGVHYFDSLLDVLNKVAADPKLIELEAEAQVTTLDLDDLPDHQRPCYLKPRISTSSAEVVKFVVVDSSLAHAHKSSKGRELRSLPSDYTFSSNLSSFSSLIEVPDGYSPDEQECIDMSWRDQKRTNSPSHAKDGFDDSTSDQRMQINGSEAAKEMMESRKSEDTRASNKQQSKRTIKHQSSQGVKPLLGKVSVPRMKRQKLTARDTVEISRSLEHIMASSDACEIVVSEVDLSRERLLSSCTLAEGSPEKESTDIVQTKMSPEKIEKPKGLIYIDLNLSPILSDSEDGEFHTDQKSIGGFAVQK